MATRTYRAYAMVDYAARGTGFDVTAEHRGLVSFIDEAAADSGVRTRIRSEKPAARVLLELECPARNSFDEFMTRLGRRLDTDNRRPERQRRLRVIVVADDVPPSESQLSTAATTSYPLLHRVLNAAAASSLVVAISESLYSTTRSPTARYSHVHAGGDRLWIRVPGRTPTPGLIPADTVVLERAVGNRATSSDKSAHTITIHGNHYGDIIDGNKEHHGPVYYGSVQHGTPASDRPEAETPRDPEPDLAPADRSKFSSRERLRIALVDAYPSFDELAVKLGKNLHRVGGALQRLDLVVRQLIDRAGAEGWLSELVTTTYLGNTAPSGGSLEKIFRRASAFQDSVPFTTGLLAAAGQVCGITVDSRYRSDSGTGILVGPDLVLTSHHVISGVIDGSAEPGDIRCVFDFHADTASATRSFELSSREWLVAASPPSAVDFMDEPTGLPAADELDYALIRLAGPAAETETFDGRERGWMRIPRPAPKISLGLPLLIVQHPQGRPQQLSVDHDGVRSINANRTRLTHRANTEPGSSGSPCLTFDLELVALHHSGRDRANEAIPIEAITAHLSTTGHSTLFER